MRRITCQVLHLVGVAFQIKQALDRARFKKLSLCTAQLSGLIQLPPLTISSHLIAIVVLKTIEIEWLVVSHVTEPTFANRTNKIILLVETIGITKAEVTFVELGQCHILPQKRTPIQPLGHFDSREIQHGGGQIDKLDKALDAASRLGRGKVLPVFRNMHHHRHMKTIFVGIPLATRQNSTVIAIVKNEGVIHQTILFQLLKKLADPLVKYPMTIMVTRVGISKDLGIRMITV